MWQEVDDDIVVGGASEKQATNIFKIILTTK